MADFVFSCPVCGDPAARTVEADVDIHSGATYRCDKCDSQVIFTVQTPEQYIEDMCSHVWNDSSLDAYVCIKCGKRVRR
jgi:DNA-directed RNA polymerase subunit RPC12/RpoP